MTASVDCDVAIIGYGPSGVSAANFLGQYGIKTIVFERDTAIYPRARAVTVNDWTLRAYQTVGLDQALLADMDQGGTLLWKTYAGKELMRLEPTPPTMGQPTSSQIYQPAMEATLRGGVERFGDVVDVRFGASVTGITQDDDAVTIVATDNDSGEVTSVRARYALACDGGSSMVRTTLGIGLDGKTYDQTWVIIDARVKKWWPGRNVLTFWSDPERPVVDIPLALGHHRWELPLRPGEDKADLASKEALWELLSPFGVTPEHVEILQHAFYVHHVRKAEHWRRGRVFLLGDSAHMMPPWAGQGMQSGIRDVQNIVWKLRSVLFGQLPDSVLDTYQPERAPQVAEMTAVAEKLGMMIGAKKKSVVFLRNNVVPILDRLGLARAALKARPPRIDAGYLTDPGAKNSAVGSMIPQPQLFSAAGDPVMLDSFFGDGFAVVGYDVDPRVALPENIRRRWDALDARYVVVRGPRSQCADLTELVDADGTLGRWFSDCGATIVAVRPDRFVAASDAASMSPPLVTGTPSDTRTAAPQPTTDAPAPDLKSAVG